MDVDRIDVTVRDLVAGYSDNGEGGVVGYSGRLDIRPRYQREFVYREKQRDEVIRSVLDGFPLNVMYWALRTDGRYEVLDGQQRTISICRYVTGAFSVDGLFYNNQPDDKRAVIDGYELTVYLCDGEASEKLKWFEIVNIAGERLFDQELRNAVYHGPWLAHAKQYFSRSECPAKKIGDPYLSGSPIRQDLLETAIRWAGSGEIKDYMGRHQWEESADELWAHFEAVIEWVAATFPKKRSRIMRKVDWGPLHALHGGDALDPDALEEEIGRLVGLGGRGGTNPIRNLPGIYEYVLDRDERHLDVRAFDDDQKLAAYERQDGKCAICGGGFEFEEMEGDHIKPWRDGGLSSDDNLQMLCVDCNRSKGAG